MDSALRRALADLQKAGAAPLPSQSTVEKAADGTEWSGSKKDGQHWKIQKLKTESYQCEF